MKKNIFLLIAILWFGYAPAQKISKKFSLPAGVTKSDYHGGSVLVKLKKDKRENFLSSGGIINSGGKSYSSKPLVNEKSHAQARSYAGPYSMPKSGIDMSLYHRIYFSKTEDIEQVINELYATVYFDIVEPVYQDKMDYSPNDPSTIDQYYLELTKAFEAWDISQGDVETVIAIVDSGSDLDHPDLISQLYTNPDEIANNGNDDDNDGYIDNVQGWDFVGGDTLNIFNSTFTGDNNPQLFKGGSLSHGVWVGGCASAATDNGVGIAGVGFNTKLLFTKHTADNQDENDLSVFFGYDGIVYAAETLTQDNIQRKIINCSWGSSARSQIAQDIITYVTLDLGCLVIGAAGNDNTKNAHYPSGYDYVLSVAATTESDLKASFSNFGSTVDISAPGTGILSTQFDNAYGTVQGTSFSAPITAGAAALVWSHDPSLTPLQVAEQVRVTADVSIYEKNSSNFKNLLGKGRLDIHAALTLEFPSIRAANPKLVNQQGGNIEPGQSGSLELSFTNFLKSSTSGLTVSVASSSSDLTFQTSELNLGFIETGASLKKSFPISIEASVAENTRVDVTLTFSDGSYSDFQIISFLINPSYLDIDENKITTSVSSRGRIGFDDPNNQDLGSGFIFNDAPILFEMGLIMGSSSATISNNVRGINGAFDQDFTYIDPIREAIPGERSTSEVYGSFANASTLSDASLQITYRSLVWSEAPYDQFVILEYKVKNNSSSAINDFYFGVFADWDISTNGGNDAAGWEASKNIGFIYPKQSADLPHAGIQVLNQPVNYYAIDNDQDIAGNPFGVYDGYSDDEKFISLNTERLTAGETTAEGNDVSYVVSTGPFSMESGEEITIAYALHAANNFSELLTSAAYADTAYNFLLNAPKPVVADSEICYGEIASVTATGASFFNWYTEFTGGSPIFSGPTLITPNLFNDTTFYVSNADQSYESVRTPANVLVKANPQIFSSSASFFVCGTDSLELSVAEADEYEWSNGATTQTILVSSGDYSVTVRDNSLNCESTSGTYTITSFPKPQASFSSSASQLISHEPIQFTDGSIDAVAWFWDFGDTETSAEQNPTHSYADGGSYQVTLTVTAENGCQDSYSETFDIITGTEKELESAVVVYPNPAKENIVIEAEGLSSPYFNIQLLGVQWQTIYRAAEEAVNGKMVHSISAVIPAGLYFVKVSNGNKTVIRKVIKLK